MNQSNKHRRGMVLLIVLGMLGLFSLLAVTYMVYSGQSRTSGLIINRAKMSNPGKVLYDPNIILQVLRGSSNNQSAFWGHSLLGDVYGRQAITGYVRITTSNFNYNAFLAIPEGAVVIGKNNVAASSQVYLPSDSTFCKIPLNYYSNTVQKLAIENQDADHQELSPIDDAYNARIFTMLEGPLEGYSFRILKYIGNEGGTASGSNSPYVNANFATDSLSYSILIDLSEVPQDVILTGYVNDNTKVYEHQGNLANWVANTNVGTNPLFYAPSGMGYNFLINDAVYNGIGYGYNPGRSPTDPVNNPLDLEPIGGNLTQYWTDSYLNRTNIATQLRTVPTQTQYMPVGLLPNYNYIDPNNLLGSTNEGMDVADYRDFWLANVNPDGAINTFLPARSLISPMKVIPSFHRPELVWYTFRKFQNDGGVLTNIDHVRQLIRLLDYACARPLPVLFINGSYNSYDQGIVPNSAFFNGPIQPLIIDEANWPGANGVANLNLFVQSLATGGRDTNGDGVINASDTFGWDVDNDGDGILESVWIDPGLPLITGPDGKMLKVLSAVYIQDLDSKINANLAGDTMQGFATYYDSLNNTATNPNAFVRTALSSTDLLAAQGNGVGPAELGLYHLLPPINSTATKMDFVQSIIRARNGSDQPSGNNFDYELTGVPGQNFVNGGDDVYSVPFEHGLGANFLWGGDSLTPRSGYPLLTRGRTAMGLDLFGNISMFNPTVIYPSGTTYSYLSETRNDGYELNQNGAPNDQVFTLEELEQLLRRYDSDINNLSSRFTDILKRNADFALNSEVNRVFTTRSNELRNLPIGIAARDFENGPLPSNPTVTIPRLQNTGNVFEWLAAFYEQRHRSLANQNQELATNDPSMVKGFSNAPVSVYPYGVPAATFAPSVVRALFPVEFRHGLRMNLNRPFGNGFDNNPFGSYFNVISNDTSVVDDPGELALGLSNILLAEREHYGTIDGSIISSTIPYVAQDAPLGYYDIVRWNTVTNQADTYPTDGQPRYINSPMPNWGTTPTTNPINPISLTSRQIFARQLYCLAQLIIPIDYQFSGMNDLTAGYTGTASDYTWYKRRARILAQWAINVVDFRDPDAIMTRFEYDYLPFGSKSGGTTAHASGSAYTDANSAKFSKDPGWQPEAGDVVWGMEYPELLLTETLAFHDKRVRERKQGTPSTTKPTQFRIPQGSLFVELVNTRSPALATSIVPPSTTAMPAAAQNAPAVPKELYVDINNNSNSPNGTMAANVALDLDQLAPAPPNNTNAYGVQPVWRIGVVDGKDRTGADIANYQNFDAAINQQSANGTRSPGTINQAATANLTQTNQTSPVLGAAPEYTNSNGLVSDLTGSGSQVYFDRVIWFTSVAPSAVDGGVTLTGTKRIPNLRNGESTADNRLNNRVFYNHKVSTTSPGSTAHPNGSYLPLGSYLVLAPRDETHIGSLKEPGGRDINTDDPQYVPSTQKIAVEDTVGGTNTVIGYPKQLRQYRLTTGTANSTVQVLTNTNPCVVQISQADPPSIADWNATSATDYTKPLGPGEGIGLNVSEPLPTPTGYYDRPTVFLNTDTNSQWPAHPVDTYRSVNTGADAREDIFDDNTAVNPILAGNSVAGTKPNFRSLYLQRLADPLQPYDPVWNPYITVDAMTVDLTVFTGENSNQDYVGGSVPTFALESRFKDGRSMDGTRASIVVSPPAAVPTLNAPINRDRIRSYFSASTAAPVQTTKLSADPAYFSYEVGINNPNAGAATVLSSTSLGYLNLGHSNGTVFDGFGLPTALNGQLGVPNPNGANGILQTSLFWANRDFANPSELMLVPFTDSGKLSTYFTTALGGVGVNGDTLVQSTTVPTDSMFGASSQRLMAPFGHLFGFADANALPFNVTTFTNNTPSLNAPPRREPYWSAKTGTRTQTDFSLLMDLVETPPRYPDTAKELNPYAMTPYARTVVGNGSDTSNNTFIDTMRNRMLLDFRAPYNQRKSYTSPGKININTVDSELVWNSIEWNARATVASREAATGSLSWDAVRFSRRGYPASSNLNPNIDERFPTQFAGSWRNPFNINITPTNDNNNRAAFGVLGTWRRTNETNYANVPTGTSVNSILANPLMSNEQHARPIEQVANAYVNIQRTGRLSNLVTNQSNVFAVWVTVGLFEWDPVNGLGKEYVGTDGRTDRQRSFYIIDRTVPVAYREGNTFNVEKAILLRRNISRRY